MSKLGQSDIDFQITETGIEEQLKLLQTMPPEMTKQLTKAVRQGNAVMKAAVIPRVRRFTGSTADSIKSRVKKGTAIGSVTGIVGPSNKGDNARAHIFRFMQDGTYWQNAENTQPAVRHLIGWVEAKFGTTGKESERAAYALAISIKKKGVKGVQIARPVMESNKGRVIEILKTAVDAIVEAMKVNG
ncbi:MAG: hypothetical protein FD147_2240 [Chloroflexi bacterium]|nr:MAG: hypothetical protein FD147_2240 [Chloroflexota bacterium]